MNLSDRIQLIIKENKLRQKEFSKSLNVTESYISKLLRGESGLSNSTALLIEEKYGYSAEWITAGSEPKMSRHGSTKDLTPIQRKLISAVEHMDNAELAAVLAFITSLDEYKKVLNEEDEK